MPGNSNTNSSKRKDVDGDESVSKRLKSAQPDENDGDGNSLSNPLNSVLFQENNAANEHHIDDNVTIKDNCSSSDLPSDDHARDYNSDNDDEVSAETMSILELDPQALKDNLLNNYQCIQNYNVISLMRGCNSQLVQDRAQQMSRILANSVVVFAPLSSSSSSIHTQDPETHNSNLNEMILGDTRIPITCPLDVHDFLLGIDREHIDAHESIIAERNPMYSQFIALLADIRFRLQTSLTPSTKRALLCEATLRSMTTTPLFERMWRILCTSTEEFQGVDDDTSAPIEDIENSSTSSSSNNAPGSLSTPKKKKKKKSSQPPLYRELSTETVFSQTDDQFKSESYVTSLERKKMNLKNAWRFDHALCVQHGHMDRKSRPTYFVVNEIKLILGGGTSESKEPSTTKSSLQIPTVDQANEAGLIFHTDFDKIMVMLRHAVHDQRYRGIETKAARAYGILQAGPFLWLLCMCAQEVPNRIGVPQCFYVLHCGNAIDLREETSSRTLAISLSAMIGQIQHIVSTGIHMKNVTKEDNDGQIVIPQSAKKQGRTVTKKFELHNCNFSDVDTTNFRVFDSQNSAETFFLQETFARRGNLVAQVTHHSVDDLFKDDDVHGNIFQIAKSNNSGTLQAVLIQQSLEHRQVQCTSVFVLPDTEKTIFKTLYTCDPNVKSGPFWFFYRLQRSESPETLDIMYLDASDFTMRANAESNDKVQRDRSGSKSLDPIKDTSLNHHSSEDPKHNDVIQRVSSDLLHYTHSFSRYQLRDMLLYVLFGLKSVQLLNDECDEGRLVGIAKLHTLHQESAATCGDVPGKYVSHLQCITHAHDTLQTQRTRSTFSSDHAFFKISIARHNESHRVMHRLVRFTSQDKSTIRIDDVSTTTNVSTSPCSLHVHRVYRHCKINDSRLCKALLSYPGSVELEYDWSCYITVTERLVPLDQYLNVLVPKTQVRTSSQAQYSSLSQHMKRQVFLRIVRDLLIGLDQLHNCVYAVHRDISFHNVMMRPVQRTNDELSSMGFNFMDAVLIDCNLAIPREKKNVPTGIHGTPGFIVERASTSNTGPNDSFSSPASDVLSAGVFIACLFRYVTLGSHRSDEWRKKREELHDGAFLDGIMEFQLREWEHLLSVIKADESTLRQQQQRLISTYFNTHHHFLEPHKPMQRVLHQLVNGMMHFDCEKRMTVPEALHLVETQLLPAAMMTYTEDSRNSSAAEHITYSTIPESTVHVARYETEQTEQQRQQQLSTMVRMGPTLHQSTLPCFTATDADLGKENSAPHVCNKSKGQPTNEARKPLSAIAANRQHNHQNLYLS